MTSSARPLRIGVIGAGQMAMRVHLPILKRLADEGACVLVEVCDINPVAGQSAKSTFAFERSSHEATSLILSEDVEVVYIFGTVQMHYEYGMAALRAGKHLFVEKPPAPDTDALQQMIQEATERKLIAVVGFNRRFAQPTESILSAAQQEALRSIEGTFHKPGAATPVPFGTKSWLMANAIHALDLICYVAGEKPTRLTTVVHPGPAGDPRDAVAVLEWKSGLQATFLSNNSTGMRKEAYVFHWYDKAIEWEDETVATRIHGGDTSSYTYEKNDEGRGFLGEHQAFFDAIHSGTSPINSLATAVTSLHLIALIENGYSGEIEWPSLPAADSRPPARAERDTSILILSPQAMRPLIPELDAEFNLVYAEDMDGLSSTQKKKVKAIITGPGGAPITEELLDAFPDIAIAGVVGASVRKYSPELLLERNIPIINASDAYAVAVAEFVVMQALVGVRNASRSHDVMKKGGWGTVLIPLSKRLTAVSIGKMKSVLTPFKPFLLPVWRALRPSSAAGSKKAGTKNNFGNSSVALIGWGSIAREVVRQMQPFGCRIRVHSEHLSEEEARELGIEKCDLGRALDADVVSLHRGLTHKTLKSFGADELARLKPGIVFINTARGQIVDEEALYQRLKKGDIFACLDVFAEEPLPARSPLRALPNVFLTSHLAGATGGMYESAATSVAAKIRSYLKGERVEGIIESKERLATMT